MIENAYFALRFDVWCLSILVFSILLNAFLSPKRGDKWFLAKKLAKPLLIFSASFVASTSVYLAHEAGLLFEDESIYPAHWTKLIFQAAFIYAFWSCIDAFTDEKSKTKWKWVVTCILASSVLLFGVLQAL